MAKPPASAQTTAPGSASANAPARVIAPAQYARRLDRYARLPTREVTIGGLKLGGSNPIRIQSMTTTDTMDTAGTVAQAIRMIEAGCELVRVTAPSKKEADNLGPIKRELRAAGYETPLVADIHFTPNAAEIAARIVEKVRVNPGNYADKKKFQFRAYTDAEYAAELERIYERFSPLVKLCRAEGTAMRIGTNHGSLSDRILSRYGDTPEGMAESALEFVDICEDHGFREIVISMKASNTQVMVQAYRLLAHRMLERGTCYPLHLGVTEAGDGQAGRIKSAMGIGALLQDGLGDTIRVSLTEAPEAEMPAGYYIRDAIVPGGKAEAAPNAGSAEAPPASSAADPPWPTLPIDPYDFRRRASRTLGSLGGTNNAPRVIADLSHRPVSERDLMHIGHYYSPQLDKWSMTDMGADYVYTGSRTVPFMLPNGLRALYDAGLWRKLPQAERQNTYPVCWSVAELAAGERSEAMTLLCLVPGAVDTTELAPWAEEPLVLVLRGEAGGNPWAWRAAILRLMEAGLDWPVILQPSLAPQDDGRAHTNAQRFALAAAARTGEAIIDGLPDGLWLRTPEPGSCPPQLLNETAFGMLQAGRLRITRTEYISCPSCGRTLFDLEETTAMIRRRTDHLKGVKIGIMGCIVNGPGEMADADYGYVGSGPGKITLYRGKEVVKRNVPSEEAVDELIRLISEDGNWTEPARLDG